MAERVTVNHLVAGSIPAARALVHKSREDDGMADVADSKSAAFGHEGSSPSLPTYRLVVQWQNFRLQI